MSSSRLPSDCTIQGPSWDEFDRSEELDYNSGSDHETDEQGCRSRNFDLVAPPGFCATARQIQMHVDEVRLAQSNYLDQLPNSVNELGTTASSDQQRYGSYLCLI
uniref:Bm12553 n=1 Tax=Brugia malayi TaxID=6279 RepID=A0A1I9GBM2_BRUMA|nr:Bm12553 [Brugia malayi]